MKLLSSFVLLISSFILLMLSMKLCFANQTLTLTAEVDRQIVNLNESFTLTITANKHVGNKTIDFSALDYQFAIVRQNLSSSSSIINGQIATQTQWLFKLEAKQTGKLTIPSFEYQGVFSKPITIEVNKAAVLDSNNKDIFLESFLNKTTSYIQEEILYSIRLYYLPAISKYKADPFNIDNAFVEQVATNEFKQIINGKRYNVFEKVYSINPQISGDFTIPEQIWTLEKPYDFFSSRNLVVKSKPETFNVKTIPSNFSVIDWLPSSKVTLESQWESSVIQAKAGEPLTLTLRLRADNLRKELLPELNLANSDDYNVYNDQAKREQTTSTKGINSVLTRSFAIIPKKAGTIEFPAITLPWWNTVTQEKELITLPSQTLVVAASDLKTDSNNLSLPTLATTNDLIPQSSQNKAQPSLWLWQLTTGLSTLLAFILGIYLYYYKHKIERILPESDSDQKREIPVKKLLQAMGNAAEKNQLQQLYQLVQQWGCLMCSSTNTEIIAQHYPMLRKDFIQLNQALYGTQQSSNWNAHGLVKRLKNCKPIQHHVAKQNLVELYHQ